MARILLIDDDAGGRQMAAYNLRKSGHTVYEADNGSAGLSRFDEQSCDLVITDVRMPELSGIEVTRRVRERSADVPILVITAFGNIDTAVEAMKAGAYDFVVKPFSRDQLLLVVERALDHRRLEQDNRDLRRKLLGVERPIVAESGPMAETVRLADRVAESDATVLVTGESGTGKELIARRIHAHSRRDAGPFVTVNCAAIPAELIEAELFGHERGAFTGALRPRLGRFRQADGGTLFLDEVAELPPQLQSKLLRVLQEGMVDVLGADEPVPVDARIIAATNRDLRAAVASKAFREDLYFRLAVVEMQVPPLRDRPEDIPGLAEHFVHELSGGRDITISRELVQELVGRPWPGNVRELRNACERMAILCRGNSLDASCLPDTPRPARAGSDGDAPWFDLPAEGFSLLDLEKRVIERVLALEGGNITRAARYLQVPRHILVYRIGKYGIERPA